MKEPDRRGLERQLSDLYDQIKRKQERLRMLCGEQGQDDSQSIPLLPSVRNRIVKLQQEIKEKKAEFRTLKAAAEKLSEEISAKVWRVSNAST